MVRCPGQDQRFWKPGDIFEVKCPGCGGAVEFFKDEPKLKCPKCGQMVVNPKIDLGCAQWCKYAEQCIGVLQDRDSGKLSGKSADKTKKASEKKVQHLDN